MYPLTLLAGLTPYEEEDEDDLSQLDFETINLLDDYSIGSTPTLSIVSSKTYVSEVLRNSTAARTTLLPPQFILALSFKPNNNTALRLLSSMHMKSTRSLLNSNDKSHSQPFGNGPNSDPSSESVSPSPSLDQNDESDGSSQNSSQSEVDVFASLLLSTTATYLQRGRYFDIWENVSSASQHSLVFIVTNGVISSCLDGEFRNSTLGLSLWEGKDSGYNNSEQPLILQFSSYLHSVHSLVSQFCMLAQYF